ncbi:MAG: transporter substrate-binding domain-containing protein, partial [Chitinophagaceae bacterium]
VVGVAGTAPFIVNPQNGSGISLEIWQALASQLGWKYTFKTFVDVPSALQALASGEIDAVVGPVSITADREKNARFSQPYYQSSLSILSRTDKPTLWQRIRPFFSGKFFAAAGIFILILAGVGFLLWLAEHEKNSGQFDPEIVKGIGDGMWCAIVTMSTTGYGDKAPVTFRGRVVAGCWMVISIIFATTLVAGIASTLTLTGLGTSIISNANELSSKKVAVVPDSPAEAFIERYGAKDVPVETLKQGYDLLKKRQVDAVVFDRPQILYFLKEHHDNSVTVSTAEYVRQGYGFALPLKTRLIHPLDIALLQLQESGRVDRIVDEWLGEDE